MLRTISLAILGYPRASGAPTKLTTYTTGVELNEDRVSNRSSRRDYILGFVPKKEVPKLKGKVTQIGKWHILGLPLSLESHGFLTIEL